MGDESLWDASTRQRIVSSINPFDYAQNPFKVLGRLISGSGDTTDAQVKDMIERVYPTGLNTGAIEPWREGDLAAGKKPPLRVAERLDMVQLSANLPQKYGTMRRSEYKPTKGAEPKDKFYTFNDPDQMNKIFSVLVKTGHLTKMKKGKSYNVGYGSDVAKGKADIPLSNYFVGLERFQVSVGEDKKGKYLAVFDPWDIDKYKWAGSKKVFPGFYFYDRVYFGKPTTKKLRKSKTEDKLIDTMKKM